MYHSLPQIRRSRTLGDGSVLLRWVRKKRKHAICSQQVWIKDSNTRGTSRCLWLCRHVFRVRHCRITYLTSLPVERLSISWRRINSYWILCHIETTGNAALGIASVFRHHLGSPVFSGEHRIDVRWLFEHLQWQWITPVAPLWFHLYLNNCCRETSQCCSQPLRPFVLYSPTSLLLQVCSLALNELWKEVLALRELFQSNVAPVIITQSCP